ncbi:MAG: hypothetical protein ACRC0O_07295, partial [Vibrio metschnikovii]
ATPPPIMATLGACISGLVSNISLPLIITLLPILKRVKGYENHIFHKVLSMLYPNGPRSLARQWTEPIIGESHESRDLP